MDTNFWAIVIIIVIATTAFLLFKFMQNEFKKQEIVRLVNDISYELSNPNCKKTFYSYSTLYPQTIPNIPIRIDKEELLRERNHTFKKGNLEIKVYLNIEVSHFDITGSYDKFEYRKSVFINL